MGSLSLQCPKEPSATGAFRLEWSGAAGQRVRLEEDGQLIYAGPQRATTVSGRTAGTYTYRLRAGRGEGDGAVATCQVEVRPPSMTLSLSLLGIGLVVFVATLVLVVRGHRAHRRGALG